MSLGHRARLNVLSLSPRLIKVYDPCYGYQNTKKKLLMSLVPGWESKFAFLEFWPKKSNNQLFTVEVLTVCKRAESGCTCLEISTNNIQEETMRKSSGNNRESEIISTRSCTVQIKEELWQNSCLGSVTLMELKSGTFVFYLMSEGCVQLSDCELIIEKLSSRVCGDQNRYFRPQRDLFLNLTYVDFYS